VDLTAWVLKDDGNTINKAHHFSSDITNWKLQGATPAIGEYLYTNSGSKLLKITDDTVKVHDMVSISSRFGKTHCLIVDCADIRLLLS
jgi:hypothetical protein